MEYISLIPIIISVISLFISLYVAYGAWRFNEIAIRNSSRQEHIRFMVDIDQNLIDDPNLWAIYDSHPLSKMKKPDPLIDAKREAFIYLHFNLFEIVHSFYMDTIIRMGKIDTRYWQSWDKYIYQFMRHSSESRKIFKEQRTKEIYPEHFVSFIIKKIDQIENEGKYETVTTSLKTA